MIRFRIKESTYSDGTKSYSAEYLTPKELGDARLNHLAGKWFSCYDNTPTLGEGEIVTSNSVDYIKNLIPAFKKKYREEVLTNPNSTYEKIDGLPSVSKTNYINID
jgi:hypothetical protein